MYSWYSATNRNSVYTAAAAQPICVSAPPIMPSLAMLLGRFRMTAAWKECGRERADEVGGCKG